MPSTDPTLVLIMILTIFIENLKWLVSNKWSISKESMYSIIRKGLWTHGFKFLSIFFTPGYPLVLLPFLVGWICNYLDLSLQVVKFKTKFCSSNSDVVNALTARNYSTLVATPQCSVENFNIDPWLVTGFLDGEGCFHVSITENKNYQLAWQVRPRFQIGIHVKDKALLEDVKNYLRVGKIYKSVPELIQLKVQSLKELETVINHFEKFPLNTKNRSDFKLLKMVIIKIKRKKHLTLAGLRKIVAIKAAMSAPKG